jgi:phenol hydroxylase P0 protein
VLQKRANGFVDFEFSVGWPELTVELAMTEADFEAFCQVQKAKLL